MDDQNEEIDGSGFSTTPSATKSMSEKEQKEKRASIRAVLADLGLSQLEKSRKVQELMDGRRRSSIVSDVSNDTKKRSIILCDNDDRIRRRCSIESDISIDPDFMDQYDITKENNYTGNVIKTMPLQNHIPKCMHYKRNCNIVAPCCGTIFGCRICHDECDELLPPMMQSKEPMNPCCANKRCLPDICQKKNSFSNESLSSACTHHNIDRYAIKEITCKICSTRQPSNT